MTVRFLLDTNTVSDLVRNPQGKCAGRIAAVGEHNVSTSVIVTSELRYGALKKNSVRLEGAGTPSGANDLLIASHALAVGLTLVTDNEREFDRIEQLQIENWLK